MHGTLYTYMRIHRHISLTQSVSVLCWAELWLGMNRMPKTTKHNERMSELANMKISEIKINRLSRFVERSVNHQIQIEINSGWSATSHRYCSPAHTLAASHLECLYSLRWWMPEHITNLKSDRLCWSPRVFLLLIFFRVFEIFSLIFRLFIKGIFVNRIQWVCRDSDVSRA